MDLAALGTPSDAPSGAQDSRWKKVWDVTPAKGFSMVASTRQSPDLCGNQPVEWTRPAKLQTSLSRPNRSRFG
jgi:hypothetical protein